MHWKDPRSPCTAGGVCLFVCFVFESLSLMFASAGPLQGIEFSDLVAETKL